MHILAGFHHLDGIDAGAVHTGQGTTNDLPQHTIRCLRFRAAFHHHGITSLPTERGNLRDRIRTRFKNCPDDANRAGHLRQDQAHVEFDGC